MPIFQNKGSFASGTTSCSPSIPTNIRPGDLLILSVATSNQAVTTPSGWTQVTTSPVGQGTAAAAGATRITAYYRSWSSSDSSKT